MATGEQIKLLIESHYKDEDRFRSVAVQIAAYEANKGHTVLATDIKKILDKAHTSIEKNIKLDTNLSELIDINKTKHHLSELILNDEISSRIKRIIKEYIQRDKLKRHGLTNRRKILLAGYPGTGKTMTADVLATELNLPLCTIMMDKVMTKYMGETSVKLRKIFDNISEYQAVYLFDEFDAIGSERSLDNDIGEIRRVLNSFLQFIEQDRSESIIIAATNNPQILDTALFRRFDDIIYYELPNEYEIKKLIKNRLGAFISKNIDYKLLIKECNTLSHAEISKCCDDSIKESILNDKTYVEEELILQMVKERKRSYKG